METGLRVERLEASRREVRVERKRHLDAASLHDENADTVHQTELAPGGPLERGDGRPVATMSRTNAEIDRSSRNARRRSLRYVSSPNWTSVRLMSA